MLLETTVSLDQPVYWPGDTVTLQLEVRNDSDRSFNTPCLHLSQRYDLIVLSADGREVWRWSRERGFLQVLGEE